MIFPGKISLFFILILTAFCYPVWAGDAFHVNYESPLSGELEQGVITLQSDGCLHLNSRSFDDVIICASYLAKNVIEVSIYEIFVFKASVVKWIRHEQLANGSR